MKGIGIDTDLFAKIKADDELIKENIKRVLLTVPFERVENLNFGVGLPNYLFLPLNDDVIENIRTAIIEQLLLYEPRITINNLLVSREGENKIKVDIDYSLNIIENITQEEVEKNYSLSFVLYNKEKEI